VLFKGVSIPGKGNGLVATKLIERGTRVWSEEPLFATISDWAFKKDDTLNFYLRNLRSLHPFDFMTYLELHEYIPPSRKASFEKSHNIERGDMHPHMLTLLGLFWANHIETAIFLEASWFNHSCVPNIFYSWNPNTSRGNFHAIRKIQRGEELCISYLPKYWFDISQRKQFLEENYGFTCTCEVCVDTEFAQKFAKKRQILPTAEHLLFEEQIERPGLLGDWKKCKRLCVKMANAMGHVVPSASGMGL
jgi:hypothetical protein